MAVPPAPDGEAVGEASDSTETTSDATLDPRRSRWILLGSFAVVLVCLLASLVALGRAGWSVDDLVDEKTNPQSERDQIMAVARSFVTQFSSYGPEDLDDQNKMPGYVERVEKLLSPKFATTFEESVQFAEQTVAQQQITRVGQVYAVAVERMTDDSARAIVAGRDSISVPNPKKPKEQVPYGEQTFRYEIDLVHTGGEWLVDNFGPVGTLDGQVPQDQPTQPDGSPTDEPGPSDAETGEGGGR